MPLNIPVNCVGRPDAPWDMPDYEPIPHKCDCCGRMEVDERGMWCDPCHVANAEMCGDWDDEAIAAQERLSKIRA